MANTWWICPNPNSTFFIDLIWILSLWINYLQILQNVVLDNLSCFCKLSFLESFLQILNNVVPLDSFEILQIIIPHKFWKIILTGNFFENSTNPPADCLYFSQKPSLFRFLSYYRLIIKETLFWDTLHPSGQIFGIWFWNVHLGHKLGPGKAPTSFWGQWCSTWDQNYLQPMYFRL